MTTIHHPDTDGLPPGGSPPHQPPKPRKPLWKRIWFIGVVTSCVATVLILAIVLVVAATIPTAPAGSYSQAPAQPGAVASTPAAAAQAAPAAPTPSLAPGAPASKDADSYATGCFMSIADASNSPPRPQLGDPTSSWISFVNYYIADLPSSPENFDERGFLNRMYTTPCVLLDGGTNLFPISVSQADGSFKAQFTRLSPNGTVSGGPGDIVRYWTGQFDWTEIHTMATPAVTSQSAMQHVVRLEYFRLQDGTSTVVATDCPASQPHC